MTLHDASQSLDSSLHSPNPKTITWERLEKMRLYGLGLSNRYSRHFNVTRTQPPLGDMRREQSFDLSGSTEGAKMALREARHHASRNKTSLANMRAEKTNKNNSLAPFATLGKPTCGFFFSDQTSNGKCKFGIAPSNLVKWRNIPSQ